jgi:uncharacterized short protein YbdD (DUF466 family)
METPDPKPTTRVSELIQDMAPKVVQAGRYLAQSLRLMVGVPNYDTYVAHMQATHPDQTPMTYEEFFRERQQARYGGGGNGRCC